MVNPPYLRPFYQNLARRGWALMRSNPNTTSSPPKRTFTLGSIPIHDIPSKTETCNSAIRIQKTFRGFQVRKTVKEILVIKRQVDAIEKILERDLTGLSKRIDLASLVIMICDFLKDLRSKLGSIPDYDYGVRVLRKNVNKLIMLQESHVIEILKKSVSDSDDSNKMKEKLDQILEQVENFEEIADITLEKQKFDEESDECRSVASESWEFVANETEIPKSNLFENSDENFGETPKKIYDCSRSNSDDWNNIQEQLDKILELVESIEEIADKTLEKYELNEEPDDYHSVTYDFSECVEEETEELKSNLFEESKKGNNGDFEICNEGLGIMFNFLLILGIWIYFIWFLV